MKVSEAIQEIARLGRRLGEIDNKLREENISNNYREELEQERRAIIQKLALRNSIEE